MNGIRFTLIFAFPESLEKPIRNLAATLAVLIDIGEHEITGFTVWPSLGWTAGYGIERGATVEFTAPDGIRRAVEFAAAVAARYLQDSVYLASGSGAVLIDQDAKVIEVLAEGECFDCVFITDFNATTKVLRDNGY